MLPPLHYDDMTTLLPPQTSQKRTNIIVLKFVLRRKIINK